MTVLRPTRSPRLAGGRLPIPVLVEQVESALVCSCPAWSSGVYCKHRGLVHEALVQEARPEVVLTPQTPVLV